MAHTLDIRRSNEALTILCLEIADDSVSDVISLVLRSPIGKTEHHFSALRVESHTPLSCPLQTHYLACSPTCRLQWTSVTACCQSCPTLLLHKVRIVHALPRLGSSLTSDRTLFHAGIGSQYELPLAPLRPLLKLRADDVFTMCVLAEASRM